MYVTFMIDPADGRPVVNISCSVEIFNKMKNDAGIYIHIYFVFNFNYYKV
jgi:hypothetical protein